MYNEQKIINIVKALYEEGINLTEIAYLLDKGGYRTKTGANFSGSYVHHFVNRNDKLINKFGKHIDLLNKSEKATRLHRIIGVLYNEDIKPFLIADLLNKSKIESWSKEPWTKRYLATYLVQCTRYLSDDKVMDITQSPCSNSVEVEVEQEQITKTISAIYSALSSIMDELKTLEDEVHSQNNGKGKKLEELKELIKSL